jgi:hypothetical protein
MDGVINTFFVRLGVPDSGTTREQAPQGHNPLGAINTSPSPRISGSQELFFMRPKVSLLVMTLLHTVAGRRAMSVGYIQLMTGRCAD